MTNREKQVKKALQALGFTFRINDGEYRVAFNEPNNEAAAYYTTDIDDAWQTALAMKRKREGK